MNYHITLNNISKNSQTKYNKLSKKLLENLFYLWFFFCHLWRTRTFTYLEFLSLEAALSFKLIDVPFIFRTNQILLCGGRGIRTLGAIRLACLVDRWFKPLTHPSKSFTLIIYFNISQVSHSCVNFFQRPFGKVFTMLADRFELSSMGVSPLYLPLYYTINYYFNANTCWYNSWLIATVFCGRLGFEPAPVPTSWAVGLTPTDDLP